MAQKLLIPALFWLVCCRCMGQNNPLPGSYGSWYRKAEKLYAAAAATDQTDSLALALYRNVIRLLATTSVNNPVLFDSYVKAGILEMTRNEENAALSSFRTAIALSKSSRGIPDSSLFKPYLYTGSICYARFDFDAALQYYRAAEQVVQTCPGVSESERLYNKLGVLYYETGDYKKSILYFSKALSLIEAQPHPDRFFVVNYKNNIASALRKLRRYAEALDLYKSLLPYGINTTKLVHNIGVSYLDAGEPLAAIRYLKQVPYNNQLKYNDLARASLDLNRYDAAGSYLRKALLARQTSAATQKDRDYGITLKYQGDRLMALHLTDQALASYQQALIQVDPSFNDTLATHNPGSFYGLHSSFLLFDILHAKARAFGERFSLLHNRPDLEHALAAYAAALQLAGHVERTYHSDEARLFLEQNVSEACKEGVATCILLYGLTRQKGLLAQAFGFAENSKASVLQTGLHELELNRIGGLPAGILQQQNALKVNISRLNMQLGQDTGSAARQPLQDSLRNQEIRLSLLQDRLDQHPAYYRQQFNSKAPGFDQIQKSMLGTDEALLSYYYYGSKLICFYITSEKSGYSASVADSVLFSDIFLLRRQLQLAGTMDKVLVQQLTRALYRRLVEPVAPFISGKKRLLVIPYNELSYVPFEVLTPPGGKPLLYQYAVSYNYSANFLSAQRSQEGPYQALAMAPFTGSNSRLPPLTYSAQEVEGLPGRMLTGAAATKQRFISLCHRYPVVHLATHAVVNDSLPLQSYIEFYPASPGNDASHRLYEEEIYNLDMKKALLVVLSACETGNGRLVKEEGIISLSRAFSYAGCKSTVTALWKADDAATAFIMKRMHGSLQKGMAKDEALQQAKINYLESGGVDARYKTPAYWAHLVLIGNNQPIVSRPVLPYMLYVVCGSAVLAAAVLLLKRRRQLPAHGVVL